MQSLEWAFSMLLAISVISLLFHAIRRLVEPLQEKTMYLIQRMLNKKSDI